MSRKDINTIIFDVGNVLLSFNPIEYLRKDFNNNTLLNLICNEMFRSKEWLELDRGTLEEEEFVEIISQRIPEHKEKVRRIMEMWEEMLTPIQSTIDLLPLLKEQGYSLYILSNFHKKAFKNMYEKHEFFSYFDGKLISSDYQLLKPEEEIYKKLIRLYDIDPSTTLFIDDSKENVDAAKKLGFHIIYFQNSAQIKEFFR